jgi:hypothetical protein
MDNGDLAAAALRKDRKGPCNCAGRTRDKKPRRGCPKCAGSGTVEVCDACDGSGFNKDTQRACARCEGKGYRMPLPLLKKAGA